MPLFLKDTNYALFFLAHTTRRTHLVFFDLCIRMTIAKIKAAILAIKLLDSLPPRLREATKLLADWQVQAALSWEVSGDKVVVFDDDGDPRGTIRQEQLHIGNHIFILNDLAGNM